MGESNPYDQTTADWFRVRDLAPQWRNRQLFQRKMAFSTTPTASLSKTQCPPNGVKPKTPTGKAGQTSGYTLVAHLRARHQPDTPQPSRSTDQGSSRGQQC